MTRRPARLVGIAALAGAGASARKAMVLGEEVHVESASVPPVERLRFFDSA